MGEVATSSRSELFQVVAGGLYRMLARRLDFGPAPEDIEFTAQVMHDDIVRAGFTDAHAIAVCMDKYAQDERRWPTPADIIARLRGHQRTVRAATAEQERLSLPRPEPDYDGIHRMVEATKAVLRRGSAAESKARDEQERKRDKFRADQLRAYLESPLGTMPGSTGGVQIWRP